MRVLDLFCGAGGASEGYSRAGFDVVGVDNEWQANYPFDFVMEDALTYLGYYLACGAFPGGEQFDLIHASPPCQAYSAAVRRDRRSSHPALLPETRALLRATGLPYVIENVGNAPMYKPRMLCGTMFPELRVIRHRLFEANFRIEEPPHPPHPRVFTYDPRRPQFGYLDQARAFIQVTGGSATTKNKRAAMDIKWMTGHELNQAIPPAYTEWVGEQFLSS